MTIPIPDYSIIKKYVLQNFALHFHTVAILEDCFIHFNTNYQQTFEQIYSIEPIFFDWKSYRFPVFIHQNNANLYTVSGKLSFDVFLNAFLFLSGWLELNTTQKDNHSRFPYAASLQYKYDFTAIPVVNIYFELLFEHIQKQQLKIDRIYIEQSIIFTHDIDQMRSAWFENIMQHTKPFKLKNSIVILKNILKKVLWLPDDYFLGMLKMLAIDKQHNIPAISFFLVEKSKKDADFDLSKQKYLKLLQDTKNIQSIGLHSGYATFENASIFKQQKQKLEALSQQKIVHSRQHFLRFNMAITPKIIEENHIEKDYTLGFAEHYGFRNGIANPFYLFHFEAQRAYHFLSIPLVFMDVSLTNYHQTQGENLEEKFDAIYEFLKNISSNFNTQYAILFHNSVFSNSIYKGFTEFYLKILKM